MWNYDALSVNTCMMMMMLIPAVCFFCTRLTRCCVVSFTAVVFQSSRTNWCFSLCPPLPCSASRVCVTAGVSVHGSPDSVLCSANVADVLETLFRGTADYTTGTRGDVGSL